MGQIIAHHPDILGRTLQHVQRVDKHRRIRFPNGELTFHDDAVKIGRNAEPVDLGPLPIGGSVRQKRELDAAPTQFLQRFNSAGKRPHEFFTFARVRIGQLQRNLGLLDAMFLEGLAHDETSCQLQIVASNTVALRVRPEPLTAP